jgi:hypothetical protein
MNTLKMQSTSVAHSTSTFGFISDKTPQQSWADPLHSYACDGKEDNCYYRNQDHA